MQGRIGSCLVHRLRSEVDAVAVGVGTVISDDPQLTARPEPMTRIFNAANLGTYASLNVGLAAAKGEFIAVFNDDMRAQMEWRSDLELHVREAISSVRRAVEGT